MSTSTRWFGKPPFRRVVRITRKSCGNHGGHLLVLHLECGHRVEHMNNSWWLRARRTKCEECR